MSRTSPDLPGVARICRRIVDEGVVPGVVVAWKHRDAPVRTLCEGSLAWGSGDAMAPDTIFRAFSMTKPVVGIATMMLVEDGRIGLDQPLAEILPAFSGMRVCIDGDPANTRPAARPITIRHLLTHTAGFGYHIGGDALAALYLRQGIAPGTRDRVPGPGELASPITLEEFGARLAALPLATDPGTRFEYSLSIDLLGLVVQAVSGLPLEGFLQQRLFDPLGMRDTTFLLRPEQLPRLSTLAEKRSDGWKIVDSPRDSVYARPSMPSGGGGLATTAQDYARFAALLMQGGTIDGARLLAPETVALARSNLLPPPVDHIELPLGYTWPNVGFGAAMSVQTGDGEAPAGVFGWPGAAGTGCWIDPVRDFLLVFMVQYWPSDINIMLRSEVIGAAYADLRAGGYA